MALVRMVKFPASRRASSPVKSLIERAAVRVALCSGSVGTFVIAILFGARVASSLRSASITFPMIVLLPVPYAFSSLLMALAKLN